MVKISQKFVYIFLFVSSLSIVFFSQGFQGIGDVFSPNFGADLATKIKQQVQSGMQQGNGANFNNLGIMANNINGDTTVNQGNTITTVNNGSPKEEKKKKNKSGRNSNGQNLYQSNQSQFNQPQYNQYQPSPQNKMNQNISFGPSSGSNFSGIGNIDQLDSSQDINQNISFGPSNGSNFSDIGNIVGRQPQQHQQQPPVVQIVVPEKSDEDPYKVRDEAINRYEKIIEDVESNKRYSGGLLGIEGSLSDALKKETLSHIEITQKEGISFIQYLDEKNNAIKNSIGDAIYFSWMLNNETPFEGALYKVKNKEINASEILKTVDSFNKNLLNDLSLKKYVNKIKENKVSYYKNKQNGYCFDAYKAAWHVNNIVVLHSFEITSECDYVELFTQVKKICTSTRGAFGLIIEQENGNPFQVLVNKFDKKIDILTTQKITEKFKSFFINFFGEGKALENRIMQLERKNHANPDCFAAVAKAIGIDPEDINAFLKTPIVNRLDKDSKGPVQNFTQSNNAIIKTKKCGQETVVSQLGSQKTICLETENVEDWKWVFLNEAWTFAKENPKTAAAITFTGLVGTYLFLSSLSALLFNRSSSNTIVREVFDGYTYTTTYSDGSSSMKNIYSNNKFW